MAANTFKEPQTPSQKGEAGKPGILSSLLKGSFLSTDKSAGLIKFLIFLAAIAVMLIANTYYTEQKIREMEATRQEVTRLRTIYITNKSELMRLSNQSVIARRLRAQGFVESTTPPQLITDARNRRNFLLRINTGN